MSRILILFSSHDGQTRRIASRVGEVLARAGHETVLRFAGEPGPRAAIEASDAVIVGAPIRYGHYPKRFEALVREHLAALRARPNAFFSVCLTAGGPGAKPAVASGYVRDFVERTGWQPGDTAILAGALLYRKYNPFIRLMMRFIVGRAGGETDTSRDYEYTDWDAVERFATRFAAAAARGSERSLHQHRVDPPSELETHGFQGAHLAEAERAMQVD